MLLRIFGNKSNALKFWKSFKDSGYNNKNISQQKISIRYNDIKYKHIEEGFSIVTVTD